MTEIDEIGEMTEEELLDYILCDPTVLTDSYYRAYGNAVNKRYIELRKEKK